MEMRVLKSITGIYGACYYLVMDTNSYNPCDVRVAAWTSVLLLEIVFSWVRKACSACKTGASANMGFSKMLLL